MPDTLIDGDFTQAQPVGAPRYEYPFRLNGDRVTALFEQDYWQLKATFTPAEFSVSHPTLRDFYLVKETPPQEFIAGLYKFTRTFSRIPARQTDWSSILVPLPEPTSAGFAEGKFGRFGENTADLTEKSYLTANFLFARGAYYMPLKGVLSQSVSGNVTTMNVPNHSLTNGRETMLIYGQNSASFWITIAMDSSQWSYVNANAINIAAALQTQSNYFYLSQINRGSFGSGTRYLRCRRITDFYLPGVSPGIATESDIPLPADQSGSAEFIDALLAGTGDINVQVGELQRWRESPIYQITKTVISVVDLV